MNIRTCEVSGSEQAAVVHKASIASKGDGGLRIVRSRQSLDIVGALPPFPRGPRSWSYRGAGFGVPDN